MQTTPQEIEVWYVLPAIRRELAKCLLKKGLKQKEIAQLLGLTEAAVSQYIKSKRAKEKIFHNHLKQEIEVSANRIAKDKSLLMLEIQRICSLVKSCKLLCEIHKKHGKVTDNCEVCLQ